MVSFVLHLFHDLFDRPTVRVQPDFRGAGRDVEERHSRRLCEYIIGAIARMMRSGLTGMHRTERHFGCLWPQV